MTHSTKIGLYLMSAKGLAVLKCILNQFGSGLVAYVVTASDAGVERDFVDDITNLANAANLPVYTAATAKIENTSASFIFAVSWKRLLPVTASLPLIVFHDSILPRYRGFAPLVTALVNGDSQIGVTAILASNDYDRGPVIAQDTIEVNYPLKISAAIDALTNCYTRLATKITQAILDENLTFTNQDDSQATYSLWRDEYDYFINWNWDASRIQRFIDAVGFPYRGAATAADGVVYRVLDCVAVADVKVENRTPGKMLFVSEGKPIVVCGAGLIKIVQMSGPTSGSTALPLARFRTRFYTPAPKQ